MQLDLASLKSVRSFVENFLRTESRLDLLINNAGQASTLKTERTVGVSGVKTICSLVHINMFHTHVPPGRVCSILVQLYLSWCFNFRSDKGWKNRGWFWDDLWRQSPGSLPAHSAAPGPAEGERAESRGHCGL